MRLIFLDIDGVLNYREFNAEAQSSRIEPVPVAQLNWLIKETGAKVVLSSAWRYMIHGGAITCEGFTYLLRTHGVTADLSIFGITPKDEEIPGRGAQIARYLNGIKAQRVESYVVIDDDAHEIAAHKHPFVQTDYRHGLTDYNAREAYRILTRNDETE